MFFDDPINEIIKPAVPTELLSLVFCEFVRDSADLAADIDLQLIENRFHAAFWLLDRRGASILVFLVLVRCHIKSLLLCFCSIYS